MPFLLAWVWAFVCHGVIILVFSHPLPLADQWDSEGFTLMRPWLEGSLTWAEMFAPHNEHRIFTKHVFDLLLLTLNGRHWDNIVTALANAAIYAAVIGVLFAFVTRETKGWVRRVLQTATLLLPLLLSNFENTLWGFQSPFYLCCLFTLLGLRHASLKPELPASGLGLLACAAGAILSLGSGLLVPLTLACVVAIDARAASPWRRRAFVVVTLFAVTMIGYLILPRLPPENTVMSRDLGEMALGTLRMAAWPLKLWPVAWIPLLLWLPLALRQRHRPGAADLFFLGLAGWVILQSLATGYGRGHGMLSVAWRYTDSLIFGVIANLYFSCRILEWQQTQTRHWIRYASLAAAASLWLVVSGHLALASLQGSYLILHTSRTWQAQELVTRALLRGDPVAANNPALPYPHLSKMPLFLDNQTMRQLLGIVDGQLPAPCQVPAAAVLSRAACKARNLLPSYELPAFTPLTSAVVAPVTAGEPRCSLDYFGGQAGDGRVIRGSPLRWDGWVGPAGSPGIATLNSASVLLRSAQNTYRATTHFVLPRSDVAANFADARYYWTGLNLIASTAQVEPGNYEMLLQATGSGLCRTGTSIAVY